MKGAKRLDPRGLMQWLATLPEKNGACVECGAGLGELSAFLKPYFTTVVATDVAPPRLQQTPVKVVKAAAEKLPVREQSVDLLFSMQALHHFDLSAHLAEAQRVVRTGGVFAALAWGEISLPPRVRAAYQTLFEVIGPHWECAREWVISGYEGLSLPGTVIEVPAAMMRRQMTLPALEAEFAKWSAVQNALRAGVSLEEPDYDEMPFSDDAEFDVFWPIVGQVFRL